MPNVTSGLTHAEAKNRALFMVYAFKANHKGVSPYYSKIFVGDFANALVKTINGENSTLSQGEASLCGPAAFYFVLVKTRPDLYVRAAIDLFLLGKSKIGKLELKSSDKAKSIIPASLSGLDWAVFTSVKPSYDNAKERIDGITFPGKLKKWFEKSGFTPVIARTSKLFTKDIEHLLSAQLACQANYSVCLFVDADIFFPSNYSKKGKESTFPNHWVVLNSDIKVLEYDAFAKSYKAPIRISQQLLDRLDVADKSIREKTRIKMDVFTWGHQNWPAYSRTASFQAPLLNYFLRGYHGYIQIKRQISESK